MINSDNNHGITGKRKRTDQTPIQFFIRSLSKTETLVIRGYSNDSVEVTKTKIRMITGMPEDHQRLIYNGRQLSCQSETLAFYNVQNDTTIHLVGKMPGTFHLQTWKITNEIISKISAILKSDYVCSASDLKAMGMLVRQFTDKACNIHLFISLSAPVDLVMLYMSLDNAKRHVAGESIRTFINSLMSTDLHMKRYSECDRLILVFCRLLRKVVGLEDPLYNFCRSSIREIVEAVGIARCEKIVANQLLALNDAFMFVREVVVADLSCELELSMGSIEFTGLSLMCVILLSTYREYIECLHHILSDLHIILYDLLDKIERFLRKLEDQLRLINEYGRLILNNISKLFKNSEVFWQKLSKQSFSLCFLIEMFAKNFEDYRWIIEHKEVTNFKVWRYFTMMINEEDRVPSRPFLGHNIDRSLLLDVSFQYIVDQDPALLRGDLLVQFKYEEAIGPRVLREWFFLVCREMFNPHKALFVACPNDRRRFSPNSASKVHPLHFEYFTFCSRMIALALMHKIQIGVVFDCLFFLQLAGDEILLGDIWDADPSLYSSWKKILEMDSEMVDQDILSLTFVYVVEELGSIKTYANLLIQHHFITSIASQIAHFSQGFSDITTSSIKASLFRSLYLEDLDKMLDGSGAAISVEDWKAHTNYNGYEENDCQISWFWKIVEGMSAEKKKVLLFFWTSIRYLSLEGFCGLDSRLCISRTSNSCEHLPSTQTCFYLLHVPSYCNNVVMQDRIDMITQEHIGCNFGKL
ncbi:hypothetical protein R3W88_031762 [Solanum pinnatisectum]|uniref:HECT-type E3 ubiquitin transferase n=1 Tax=Solanum pinnatisectum TaxID=50273 RepID=A0AAV9LQY5_9SOLN|nr:hypothetical protein R3W88_031762 [Solanum pinnatisectum]